MIGCVHRIASSKVLNGQSDKVAVAKGENIGHAGAVWQGHTKYQWATMGNCSYISSVI